MTRAKELFVLLGGVDGREDFFEAFLPEMSHSKKNTRDKGKVSALNFIEDFGKLMHEEEVEVDAECMINQPAGTISKRSFFVACEAARLSRKTALDLCRILDVTQNGVIHFLDFLIYFPLFYKIHKRILQDPLHLATS
ncbi:hypothetical protein Ciccas_004772 [Cichlidogyrus casuarinus]|uniref:Uncharacterized protein n=1 Tax=Cichlidogyrus casuarinus TaxID=1844966 RepID=A0ABD2QBI2_9PLAT